MDIPYINPHSKKTLREQDARYDKERNLESAGKQKSKHKALSGCYKSENLGRFRYFMQKKQKVKKVKQLCLPTEIP